jgi:DNA-binding IclR family transcriptional regulator
MGVTERTGTQSIQRASALLRAVAERGHVGSPLSELASECRLDKSTAHRILAGLVRERLIHQRADRHYVLGPMLFELGLSALPERRNLQHAARNRLAALAKEAAGIAFLSFRSGDDCVCALRLGSARIDAKKYTVFPGTRRPLALTTGGAAILVSLPRPEALGVIERNLQRLCAYPDLDPGRVRLMMEVSFEHGFAVNEGAIFPLNGFGLALRDAAGAPFAAISVAGPAHIFSLDRADEFKERLRAAANDLQGASPPADPEPE